MQCNAMQYKTRQDKRRQYNAIHYNAIQYNTIQYNRISTVWRLRQHWKGEGDTNDNQLFQGLPRDKMAAKEDPGEPRIM